MAAPNIVNVTSIVAGYAASAPATITQTVLVNNPDSSNSVVKINSVVITNVTSSVANCTVAINTTAAGNGINYRIAYNIYVPPNSSLQLVDKGNFLYLTENTSLVVTSGTASSLEYVAVYETIT